MSIYPSVCGGQGRSTTHLRTWRGAWSPTTAYAPNEVVHATNDTGSTTGALYLCIQTHLSDAANRPPSGQAWQSHWELFAQPGDSLPNTRSF